MENRERTLRERVYKIREDGGRIDGSHEDDWRRRGTTSRDRGGAAQVPQADREASEKFRDGGNMDRSDSDISPPSMVAPDRASASSNSWSCVSVTAVLQSSRTFTGPAV